MKRCLLIIVLFLCFSACSWSQTYYSVHPSSHFDNNPVAGFHVGQDNVYLLITLSPAQQVLAYDLLSISKSGRLIDSISTQIADTPLTGYYNLEQYLYGANDEVLLFYQQLNPDDNTWYASAIERYNGQLQRTLNWRGPTLRYSTVYVAPDGIITAFGLHKYGDLSRTIRISKSGQQLLDSNSQAIRTAWGLHGVADSLYCFINGGAMATLDKQGVVQRIKTTGIPYASTTFFLSTVSTLTSDTALVVSYYTDYDQQKDNGAGLAKIDLEGRVLWNWTPFDEAGTARDAAALPNGGVALAMAAEDDLRIVDREGKILVRKSYEIPNQKKGLIGFRKIQFDPKDSTLWVAFATYEEFSGDTLFYQAVGVLHLDMEGNLLDTTQNIEVTNVSIPDVRRPTRVACYPNPVQGSLRLALPEGDASYSYRIIDLMGKAYQQGTLQKGQAVTIEVLSTGLFLIEVQNEEGFFFSSFIKE